MTEQPTSDKPDFSELPMHDFDEATDYCKYCFVPRWAVVDGIVIPQCGMHKAAEDAT